MLKKYSNSLMSDLGKNMKKRKTKLVYYKKTLLKHQLTKRKETGSWTTTKEPRIQGVNYHHVIMTSVCGSP